MHVKAAFLALAAFVLTAFATPAIAQDTPAVDPARMTAIVRELASPAYEGRASRCR